MDLTTVIERVKELALATGRCQQELLGGPLEIARKSTNIDLVTQVDKQSERKIIEFITANYPDHDILAEESGLTTTGSDFRWIIDPLDGTGNYVQGLPIFAVSIALEHCGETVLGVVYVPMLDQLFWALKGQGAYLNGARLAVAGKTDLRECVLATGFPYDIAENPVNNIAYFSEIVLKARAVRRFGAAAYDLACVAAGKFDGFWEMGLGLWDVAAAMLMVEEAGGRIIHFRHDRGVSIIAGNETICRQLQAEINRVDQREP